MIQLTLPGSDIDQRLQDEFARAAHWVEPPSAPDLEPGVECLRSGVPIRCNCPRHVVAEVVMLRHRDGCEGRHPEQAATPPGPPKLHGAIPCPRCGNVVFSLTPGGRRCDGPASCGNVWNPAEVASSVEPSQRPVRLAS